MTINQMTRSRIPVLDALRGIAAFAVVLYHYSTRYSEVFGEGEKGLPFSFAYGAHGVDMFFIISGFVIFMTLDKTSRASDFLVSRFSRLYPVYWIAVSLTSIVLLFADLPGREVTLGQYLVNLSMLQEFFHVASVDGVYWTLAVELRFYFWLFVLWLLGAKNRPHCFVLPWLLLVLVKQHLPASVVSMLILDHFPLFAFGIMVYALHRSTWRSRWAWIAAIASLACATPFDMVLMLVFAIVLRYQPTFLQVRVLLWLGAISYPLYLVHQNIGYVVIRSMGGGGGRHWRNRHKPSSGMVALHDR